MFVVTHEIEFAKEVVDRVIFMADGYIIEEVAPQQILGNPQKTTEQTKRLLKNYLTLHNVNE